MNLETLISNKMAEEAASTLSKNQRDERQQVEYADKDMEKKRVSDDDVGPNPTEGVMNLDLSYPCRRGFRTPSPLQGTQAESAPDEQHIQQLPPQQMQLQLQSQLPPQSPPPSQPQPPPQPQYQLPNVPSYAPARANLDRTPCLRIQTRLVLLVGR